MPKDKARYDEVYVVIDQLSKQVVSMVYYKTITAEEIAQLYIIHVYRYYRLLESIVLDHGPQFVSRFWAEFYCILGIKLKLSIVSHLQIDGQIEIINQYLDQQLRPYINYY